MKKLLIVMCVLTFGLTALGQQLPHYTNFIYNYFAYNPAVAGAVPCLEMKLGYRQQWDGFPDAPISAFANIHGKFGQNKFNFHGLGGLVETDDAGPLSFTSLHLAYAFHQRMARRYYLSTGAAVGFSQFRIDRGWMVAEDFESDPILTNSGVSQFLMPQINFGFWLYRSDRYYGFSIRNLVQNKVSNLDGDTRLMRHYHLTAGRAIVLNDQLTFKPNINLNLMAGLPAELEGAALLEWREKVTMGLLFRTGNGFGGLIKLALVKYVTLAYSYDLTVSKIRLGGLNSHEVILGIRACASPDKHHVTCSAYD